MTKFFLLSKHGNGKKVTGLSPKDENEVSQRTRTLQMESTDHEKA